MILKMDNLVCGQRIFRIISLRDSSNDFILNFRILEN
ncbi:hypothetical protein BVRB_6g135850 [Beta vulgaris subsp. vulgaris]|nr:hypothetical protein BVRB_6g135850 [Beta vulgaris subsp. vulgaris]